MEKIWFKAAQNGNLKFMKTLVVSLEGVDLDCQTQLGQTALLLASAKGYTEIVKWLLWKKADVNLFDKFGESPLSVSLYNSQFECAELILEAGGRVLKRKKLSKKA